MGVDCERKVATAQAQAKGDYTMQKIAGFFGAHYVTDSLAISKVESRACVCARPDPQPWGCARSTAGREPGRRQRVPLGAAKGRAVGDIASPRFPEQQTASTRWALRRVDFPRQPTVLRGNHDAAGQPD